MLSVKQIQIRMYAPNGAEVLVSVETDGNPVVAMEAAAALERMGLRPTPPNEFERERRSQLGCFVLRMHDNGDDTETPVVDIYLKHANGYVDRHRSMRVYLNSQQDMNRFEEAVGMSLDDIPVYDSDTPLERGRRPQRDEQYVVWPKRKVWVVWRLNPASQEDEKAPKRLFVRWEWEPGKSHSQSTPTKARPEQAETKYPPGHQVILDAVRDEARRLGLEDPEKAVASFVVAAQKKPNVRITPGQARAWVRREFG